MKDKIIKSGLVLQRLKIVIYVITIIGLVINYHRYFNGLHVQIMEDATIKYTIEGDSILGNSLVDINEKVDKTISDEDKVIYDLGRSNGVIIGVTYALDIVIKFMIVTLTIITIINITSLIIDKKRYNNAVSKESEESL